MQRHVQVSRLTQLYAKAIRLLLAAALFATLVLTATFVPVARAAAITVTVTSDDNTVNGNCTLREAIIAANTDAAVDACPAGNSADTLILPAGDYVLTIAGIGETAARTGDLNITDDVTITGAGRLSTTIDAGGIDRVFNISGLVDVQISDVKITSGDSQGFVGGGIYLSSGTLTLSNSRLTNNTGSGAIYFASGALTVINSRVDNNPTAGIVLGGTASATILNSDVSNNTTDFNGAGITNNSGGTLTVVNSTVSGNSAGDNGGGISSLGTTSLFNVTISNNTANSDNDVYGDGGGVYVVSGTLTVRNSIIAGNFDDNGTGFLYDDCSGTLVSEGYNLIENPIGCTLVGDTTGNITGISANLGPLQLNGGDTRTHALLAGSPAIDGGDPANWCVDQDNNLLNTDQRGYVRNGLCDIGAYEYLSPGTPTPTRTFTPSLTPSRTSTPSLTPSRTATASPASSSTPTRTSTPSPTATRTPTATTTRTHTPGPSPTFTSSSTLTPTVAVSPTHTGTPAATATLAFTPGYWVCLPVVLK